MASNDIKRIQGYFVNSSAPPSTPISIGKMTHPVTHTLDQDDEDDEISQQMTTSYSEISFKSDGMSPELEISLSLPLESIPVEIRPTDRAHKMLGPLDMEGSVHMEDKMTHFVAEDLEYKIKLSNLQRNNEAVGQIDVRLLNDVEFEAQRIASSIDNLTENLCGILHSMSSITADNIDVYKNAVSKMSEAMDSNIKCMYTIMAKADEITQTMATVQTHANRLKEIKKLVELLETYL